MESLTANATKNYLEGPKVPTNEGYGGLGAHFLDTLFDHLNKIHQIDTVTGVTETNGSVRSRAIQVAHELLHFGLVENDIVLICSRCHADQTVAVLACLLIGCIVAPIDTELPYNERVDLIIQLKPKLCFCDLRTLKQMERVILETGLDLKMVHFGDQPQYCVSFRKLFQKPYPEQFKPVTIDNPRKRVAFILATQGATASPKLVCLSHHFIYYQISVFLDIMDSPEKIISYYPLSWVMQVILMCLCFKVPVVRVLPGAFVERNACKLIHDLKIDHAFLDTELALQFAEDVAVKDFNISCLKCVYVGAMLTTRYDIRRLAQRVPRSKFIQVYCATEIGVVVACSPLNYDESVQHLGTVGKVVQNCKLRIVDMNTREDVETDSPGELLVASNCMMLGYYKNMAITKASTQDGFFKTGDIARYDSNGWIFFEGRIADLLSVKGLSKSPRELEDVILTHPLIKDAAVIGNDKEIVACVVPKSGSNFYDEEKLFTFVSEKLPMHKWPTRIVFVAEFPTTPLGKIRRDLLKQQILTVKIEHSQTQILG